MINNNRIYWWRGLTSAETFNGWSTNYAIIPFSLKTIINEPNLKIKKDICLVIIQIYRFKKKHKIYGNIGRVILIFFFSG